MKLAIFFGMLIATPVFAQSYLVFDTADAAHARSVAQFRALHDCDGLHATSSACTGETTAWWAQIDLTDGRTALVIRDDPFGMSARVVNSAGLTPAEQAALVPYSTIAPKLPAPQ